MRIRTVLPLIAIVLLSVIPAWAQEENAPPPAVQVSHLTGPLHTVLCNGQSAFLASVGEDGILLVDTAYAATAEAAKEALGKLHEGPVRFIINTHGDADHVGGNAFLGEGAVIIAHPYVRRTMGSYHALPPLNVEGLPTITTDEETVVHFNGDTIRILPMPGGHTAGDMVVHFTKSKVACIGDLVLNGTLPNADPPRGGNAERLARILRGLAKRLPSDTTLMAAHGGNLDFAVLNTYIEMVEGTTTAVRKQVEAGRSLEAILASKPLARWAEWERPDRRLGLDDWTRAIHAGLTGSDNPSVCAPVTEMLVRDGAEAAVALYLRLRAEEPERWNFGENQLNMLGYQLLQRGRTGDAIAFFTLNVEAYPEAFNPYDSLGEAYMTAGKNELAVTNYRKSLELNPENDNALRMLERLKLQELAR